MHIGHGVRLMCDSEQVRFLRKFFNRRMGDEKFDGLPGINFSTFS